MDRSVPGWLRAFFLLVTVQALVVAAGVVAPDLIPRLMPWDASPLNARFIAALYAMGCLSALLCLRARRYAETRIVLIEIGLVTLLLLLVTLPHLGEFAPPRPFPWGWLVSYIADPALVGVLLWLVRGRDLAAAGWNRYRGVFLGYAAVLGIVGAVLLALPGLAARLWPWELPAILGQLYSTFLLGMAACAWLAAREPRWEGVRIYVIANLFVNLLVLVVSLLHLPRFSPGASAWAWFAFCALSAALFGGILVQQNRRPALSSSFS